MTEAHFPGEPGKPQRICTAGDRIVVRIEKLAGLVGTISHVRDAKCVITVDHWPAGVYLLLDPQYVEPFPL